MAQAPAVWLMTVRAAVCFAVRSTWSVLAWGILVAFVTLGQIGELLRLPSTVVDLSPYTQVPSMPVEDFALAPELLLALVAAVLLVGAWVRYRARDIA